MLHCRWEADYTHNTGLWLFLKVSVHYRKLAKVWNTGIGKMLYVDADTMVLQRGPFVVVLTSVGQASGRAANVSSMLSVAGLADQFRGKSLQNIYNPQVWSTAAACRWPPVFGLQSMLC